MRKKISERLFDKLIELGYNPTTIPERLYPGFWQRASGHWLWSCKSSNSGNFAEIGSIYTMTQCLKAKTISANYYRSDIEVYPED